jgi:hypothetical protein
MNFKPTIDKLVELSPFGTLGSVPSIVDAVKNVVGNTTSSDADQKAKIQAVIDADRAEQQKLMAAQTRPQGRRMRQEAAEDSGYKSYKKGGKVKDPTMTYQTYSKTGKPAGMKTVTVKKASGGSVSSASKRADGCAIKGKTRGKMV